MVGNVNKADTMNITYIIFKKLVTTPLKKQPINPRTQYFCDSLAIAIKHTKIVDMETINVNMYDKSKTKPKST